MAWRLQLEPPPMVGRTRRVVNKHAGGLVASHVAAATIFGRGSGLVTDWMYRARIKLLLFVRQGLGVLGVGCCSPSLHRSIDLEAGQAPPFCADGLAALQIPFFSPTEITARLAGSRWKKATCSHDATPRINRLFLCHAPQSPGLGTFWRHHRQLIDSIGRDLTQENPQRSAPAGGTTSRHESRRH